METDKAIMSFSQSEKIKAGIIWVSQTLNILQGLSGMEQKGAERVIESLLHMIDQEAKLAWSVTGDNQWDEVGPNIDKAVLMINSGVSQESQIHLSRALSNVTTIGQRSMVSLKEKGLL